MKTLTYIAVPYSHPDENVRHARFHAVNKKAAELMNQGMHIFSPISHTHPIALAGELPLGWEFWKQYDEVMLAACHKLIVFMLDGWKESKGVQGEIEIATRLGLPIEYIYP
jgi:hypothetical protein